MKKYGILIASLVLTAALLTGCRNPNIKPTELPPTQGATMAPTTTPTTLPTTVPTTEMPTETTNAAETGPVESSVPEVTDNARSRTRTSGMK